MKDKIDRSVNYVQLEDCTPKCATAKLKASKPFDESIRDTQKDNGLTNESTELMQASQNGRNFSKRRKLIFCILFMAYFASGCGFSIPAPFFPKEAAGRNISSTMIGLVFGCYQIINFLSSPIYGHFLPDLGARTVCFTGLILAGTSTLLFGFLDKARSKSVFLAVAFILRILEGLGVSAFTTSALAIVCVEFEERVAVTFSILEAGLGAGMMVGPTIGGALFEAGGFGAPFWALGALIMTIGISVLVILPQVSQQAPSSKSRASILKLLRSPLVWVAMLLLFNGSCSVVAMEPTLALHLKQTMQGPLMMLACITCALGLLLLGPTPFFPALPKSIWLNVLALFVFGLMWSCTIVTSMKCMVVGAVELGLAKDLSTFSLVAGLFHFVFYLGAFVGPTLAGALTDAVGFGYATSVFAGLFLFTFLVEALFFGYRWFRRYGGKTDNLY